ncbi:uncharacterized protein V2V93DRAFT_360109 [Kockiozyma suomiensis]|uniref:uncharacterized protein n=1 Tax=Kockiozyma suomiensis TaxID=1337062 RepID=UPI0033433AE9
MLMPTNILFSDQSVRTTVPTNLTAPHLRSSQYGLPATYCTSPSTIALSSSSTSAAGAPVAQSVPLSAAPPTASAALSSAPSGHARRKSAVANSHTGPPPPARHTFYYDNILGVRFTSQNQQPESISSNAPAAAAILFGSIEANATTTGDMSPTAQNMQLQVASPGKSPSTTASPVPNHAVISGGVPPFPAVAATVKFGTVDANLLQFIMGLKTSGAGNMVKKLFREI